MRLEKKSGNEVLVNITQQELIALNNALNYVLNGIDLPEFSTLIGTDRKQAATLLKELGELID